MRKIVIGIVGVFIAALAIYAGIRTLAGRPDAARQTAAGGQPAPVAPPAGATPAAGAGQPSAGATTPVSASSSGGAVPSSPTSTGATPEPAAGSGAAQPLAIASGAPPPAHVHWMNLANATLGGRVESVTSIAGQREISPVNLIDNGVADTVCAPYCSWYAKGATFPQDIVLSFYRGREARIARVIIDTLTPNTRSIQIGLPRQVEIAVSTSSATDGFTTVASAELPPHWEQHAIDFAPKAARYLRVRILSTYGTNAPAAVGEIQAFESDASPSILSDFPHDLALPALGGSMVWFTSDYATYTVGRLTDGNPETDWRSSDAMVPQDFVFAFRNDETALVDHLVLTTKTNLSTAPKKVAVWTSLDSPVSGFEEVGTFTLAPTAADQPIPVRRRARFVKLRIIEGATIYTSLGEVQILEGEEPGYESVLSRATPAAASGTAPGQPAAALDGAGASVEREKNDDVSQANPLELGRAIRGAIDPIGESDYYKISLPGPSRSAVTVDLTARPNIRTSLNLLNGSGATVKRFDPAGVPAEHATFSWLVDPGDYAIQVTQPRSSVVLVWDTSGSMVRNVNDLQRAVEAYLDRVPASEVVNLIRFSYDIKVLLPDFTNDRAALETATKGTFFADGSTPFYDAMAKAAGLLRGRTGNRAIVVMTDGEDAGGALHETDFWRALQSEGIRIYTIGIGDAERYSTKLGSTPRQLLKHISMATNGRAFFAERSADLIRFYQELSDELGALCQYRLSVTRGAATGTLAVKATGERIAAVAAPAQLELILDASGSMKRAIGGRRMIDMAKAVLSDIVRGLPDDMRVALRVYGHRIREKSPGACRDSELVYPFGPLDRPRLLARIQSVQALGTTPIAYSLEQVARDMFQPGDKMVVLVTDGMEECGGNPEAVVKRLVSSGVKLKLNIVGFALTDASLKTELRSLAQLTAGQFVDVKDSGSLRSAIEQSFAVPYDVLDAAGAIVAQGVAGEAPVQVPEGIYTVRVNGAAPIQVDTVRVSAHQATTVELKKEGREVATRVLSPS